MESTNNTNRFNELIHAAPSATAIYHTRDMIITAANANMLAFWGKDDQIIGIPFLEGIPELKGQPFFEQLQAVYDAGTTFHSEQSSADLMINGKLQTSYFNYTFKPILDAAGKTEAIIHSAIDVTPMISIRRQLEDTQERLMFALESAEIGTWDLDPLNEAVHWDQRCRELFGFEGESNIDYNGVLDCIHPDDKQKVMDAVSAAIDPERLDTYDVRYRTVGSRSGNIRWVHCKGRAYFNQQSIAYRFAGTARDITSEINTSLNEQQLLALVNYNADHMSIADMSGKLIYMNQAARNMLGVPHGTDISTMGAPDFYQPEELRRVQETIIPYIDSDKGWAGILHLMHCQTKETIPCQVNYILVKNPVTGEVIGRGATARDLRVELKAKAELQRLATIVEISEDFCNYTDLQGNTIYINASGQKLIGADPNNLSNTNINHYHSETSSSRINTTIMEELLKNGKWSGSLELKHMATGELIPIHKQLFIILDQLSSSPVAIAGIARDLRAEINAKEAMDKKNTQLNQAVKELEFQRCAD